MEIPRIGMQFGMPKEYSSMKWFGRGPQENYWDRKTGAAVGLYSGKVEDLFHHYVEPQECAYRTGVRWLELTNPDGEGLRFISRYDVQKPNDDHLLSISCWPYTMEDIENASHPYKLTERDFITVNIDH